MLRYCSLLFSIVFCSLTVMAQSVQKEATEDKKTLAYAGFSGGMMLHTGYVWSRPYSIYNASGEVISNMHPKGMPTGIGGVLRFHFGKHLRIGAEGYSTTLTFGKYRSFSKIGWGGILADCNWQIGRFYPYIGATFGGGGVKNLVLLQEVNEDYQVEQQNTSYRRYGFVALTPFIGTEIGLTKKLHLNLKIDYLTNLSNWQDDFVTGPRFYVGITFCRL